MQNVSIDGKFDRVRLHALFMLFHHLHNQKSVKTRYWLCFFVGIVYAIVIFFLVDTTGLYSNGTGGFFQGLARVITVALSVHGLNKVIVTDVYQCLFWSIWFVSNIPLMLFAWFKIGKNFALLTLTFVFTATVFGLLLSTSIFVNPENSYTYFFLGDPLTFGTKLVQNHVFILSWNYYPAGSYIYNLKPNSALNGYCNSPEQMTALSSKAWTTILQLRTEDGYEDLPRVLSLFGYTALLILTYPPIISVIYMLGGSTGGTDIPSVYYSEKKKIQLGKTLTIFNSATMVFGVILGTYVAGGLVSFRYWNVEYFFSPNMIFSVVYSMLGYLLVNFYYPRFKICTVKIHTKKCNEIRDLLKNLEYISEFDSYCVENYCCDKNVNMQYVFETIVRFVDLKHFINLVRKDDQDSLITIFNLKSADGYIKLPAGRD